MLLPAHTQRARYIMVYTYVRSEAMRGGKDGEGRRGRHEMRHRIIMSKLYSTSFRDICLLFPSSIGNWWHALVAANKALSEAKYEADIWYASLFTF